MIRALYTQAQDHVSSATIARLHRARHAALSMAPRPRRSWGVPAAAGFAALLVLAAGMQLMQAPPRVAPDPAPLAAGPAPAAVDEAALDALATYDESPDFYLWLAANEATLLAVE
ncbi:hypothetical protein [Luteimonas deserti]|uniref:hypothetical protein n=1 Tax=Luteimonas deserti TaxID=2752306 RepID=UPI0015D6C191|nr:hypothetical protein [Luteimonas deserti]